uniref:Uncharacterized protein n=1 Tax=Octopus bimaculoides TaxID=37653 RepID=A0A0L8HNX1_OCTBM
MRKGRLRQAIWPYVERFTKVKKHRFRWFGHVIHSSGMVKTILQGTVKGDRCRGRLRKRWEDNICE